MKTKFFLCFLFLAFTIILFFPYKKVLVVKNRNGREKIISGDALDGFCISYTHSVNKGRVHDYYRIDGNHFIIYKTEFSSYGAGMPEIEETPGAVFIDEENTFVMEYVRDVGESFLLAVGVIADHSITIDNKEYFLKDFFEAQTSLEFRVKRVSIIGGINERRIEQQ